MKVNILKRIRLSHTLTDCMGSNEGQRQEPNVNIEISEKVESVSERKHSVAAMEKDEIKLSFDLYSNINLHDFLLLNALTSLELICM